jgi:stromal membrane-associated protein
MEGPPPDDPSVFDNAGSAAIEPAPAAATPPPAAAPSGRPTAVTPAQPVGPIRTAGVATTQPQGRQLLSTTIAGRAVAPLQSAAPAPAPAPVAAHAPVPAPQDDLFSLDFHAPPVTASATGSNGGGARKDKQDILSLFNSAPAAAAAAAPAPAALGTFGNFSAAQPVAATQSSPWDAFGSAPAQPQQSTQPQSFVGNTGVGMWGASSGWNAQAAAPAQPHVWAPASSAQQPQQALFNTSSVWGGAPAAANSTTAPDPFGSFGGSTTGAATQKKDDAFGDIWGSFK